MRTGTPSKREIRRKKRKEYASIHKAVGFIDVLFNKAVEQAPDKYDLLFARCDAAWRKNSAIYNRTAKGTKIDPEWFTSAYKDGNAKDLQEP